MCACVCVCVCVCHTVDSQWHDVSCDCSGRSRVYYGHEEARVAHMAFKVVVKTQREGRDLCVARKHEAEKHTGRVRSLQLPRTGTLVCREPRIR